MARLNVLFMTVWYPSKENRVMGVFVRECAKAVALRNNVVMLHCAGCDPNQRQLIRVEKETDEELAQGLPTYRCWHRRSPVPRTTFLFAPFLWPWSASRALREIERQGFKPDIIHAHVYSAGELAVRLGRREGIPVVITEHTTAFPRKLLGRHQIRIARRAFQGADVVMPVSESLRQAIEAYGIRAHFQVLPNVVDTTFFYPNPSPRPQVGPKRLLCVCLLDEKKGVRFLLEAVAILPPEAGPWRLDIVGDGPQREPLQAQAQALGIADKVTFHGVLSKPKVAERMRAADLLVLPSLWENLPCVIAEAMTTGLPILATQTGGLPEMVDDATGVLVPPGVASALSTAAARMLTNLDQYNRAAIAQRASLYSPDSVGSRLQSVYETCLQKYPRQG
jgi:glycosyltransferase involved in cell wall biosynthesis